MSSIREIFEQEPAELIDKKVIGPFGNSEPVQIVRVERLLGDPTKVRFLVINPETHQFYDPVLDIKNLETIKFVPEFNFSGDPQKFFMNMMGNAIRSNFNQDPLFGVGSSKIDPLPHQLEAVYKYVLPRPSTRFMIADEPGAGKTIMAGLVIKELLARGAVKRILIVVPGSLTGQWRLELKNRFNEDFVILDSDLLRSLGPRAWIQFDKIITSMDFAKNEVQKKRHKGKSFIRNSLLGIPWDLIVVDEAHKMSAEWDMRRMRERTTKRYQLGKTLSEQTDHLLFLTATPHKGKSDNFRLLLRLLEPDSFDEGDMDILPVLKEFQDEGYPIFIRRLKEEMVTPEGYPIFPPRKAKTISFSLSSLESTLYKNVTEYVKNTFNLAKTIGGRRGSSIGFMLKLLQRRLNSSVRAIHRTLIYRKERLEEILDNPDFDKSINELRSRIEKLSLEVEEAELNDDIPPRKIEAMQREIFRLTMASNPAELEREVETLEILIQAAAEAEEEQCESKLNTLLDEIDRNLGEQQLIIFTEYTDTLNYLMERIPDAFATGTIHGGMDYSERAKEQEKFWNKKIQILVCTDAASEGINLQCCWNLINYDIPWNPNRLDQRMGRIHRYLQDHECTFFNLVATKTSDGDSIAEGLVVERIFEKLEIMREELGGTDRVFDVIGEIFEEWNFEQLLVHSLSAEPIDLSTQVSKAESRRIRKLLELKSNIDVGLEFFVQQRKKSEDNRLWPKYIAEYVRLGFWYANSPVQFVGDRPFKIQVPAKIQAQVKKNVQKFGPLKRNLEIMFYKPTERQLMGNARECDYVTAGHPLLEAIIDIAEKKGQDAIQQGTVFFDPSHGMHGLLWFIEIIFTDGTCSKDILQRVIVLFTPLVDPNKKIIENLTHQILSPLILWDLRCDYSAITRVQLAPYKTFFERSRQFVVEGIGSQLCLKDELELKNWREKTKKIKMKALDRREIRERVRLETEISVLLDKEANGEDVEQKISGKEADRDNITETIQELKRLIDLECTVMRQSSRLLSVAVVVPAHDDGQPAADIEEATRLADTHAIDMAAMKAVIAYEEERGWEVEDKSKIRCGYDIESVNPRDPTQIRHIEVKGHKGEEDVFISKNEWMKAQNDASGSYWLYIVNKALERPQVIPISEPASKFNPERIITEKFKIPLTQIREFYYR